MKWNKGNILFSLLPPQASKLLEPYLTNLEIYKLTQAKKKFQQDFPASMPGTEAEIKQALQKILIKPKPSYGYFIYFLINLTLSLLFLIQRDAASALTILIYAFAGAFIIARKSNNYWKFQLLPSQMMPGELIFLGLGYIFLTLILGLYNIDTVHGTTGILFMFQAFLLGPLFEELLFRSYLIEVFTIRHIKPELSLLLSWLLSGFFFAIVHLQDLDANLLGSLVTFWLAGIGLCVTSWYLKKIFYSWLLHALVNLTIFLL